MATLRELWVGKPTREQLGGILLVVPILTFYFFVIVWGLNLSDVRSEYALLFVFAILTLLVYDNAAGISRSFRIPNFTLKAAIPLFVVAVLIVFLPIVAYALVTGSPFTQGSFTANLQVFVTQVLVVAVVEEFYFRFTLTKIYGGIVPQVLFAVSHPAVRDLLVSNPSAAVEPFLYFLLFGLVFQQLVFMGQASNVSPRVRKWFGLPLTMGLHGAYNAALILYPLVVVYGLHLVVW